MITLSALVLAMFFITVTAVVTVQVWPNLVTWVHIGVAVVAPIAAEVIHLLIR
ncbi:hypothetical protein [Mycolicibacterium sp. P1-18]|uniref:hypothetical protein n=1 Tax=Mycolicibacterium sp. P1-18 TaxID=2024615 RepID=UPI00156655CD|nr:hypothetical protein [Mycolicibacterium sp. P1-18]